MSEDKINELIRANNREVMRRRRATEEVEALYGVLSSLAKDNADLRKRHAAMHRRAQRAEGRLARMRRLLPPLLQAAKEWLLPLNTDTLSWLRRRIDEERSKLLDSDP